MSCDSIVHISQQIQNRHVALKRTQNLLGFKSNTVFPSAVIICGFKKILFFPDFSNEKKKIIKNNFLIVMLMLFCFCEMGEGSLNAHDL